MRLLLYNAEIFGSPGMEWILLSNEKIEKIGSGNLPGVGKKIDLQGALLLPGFCDSHTHLSNIAMMHGTIDLTGKKRDALLEIVKKECNRRKIVVGRGWDESMWSNKRYLTREELDSVCNDRPVFLIREDGHMAAINTFGERYFEVESDNGVVREENMEKIAKKLKIGRDLDLNYAQEYALSKGITCVHDFASQDTIRKIFKMKMHGELKIRVYLNFYESSYRIFRRQGFYSGFGDAFLKLGALKLFADGSIGARTAATKYANGKTVKPMINSEKLRKIVNDANSNGIRVFTHAIGNLAISEVIKAYRGTKGNRIEHFELATEEHIEELEDMDVEVSMQPNFLKWAKKGGLYHRTLGDEWLERNNPYRKILDKKIKLLFGSDCMPMDPLFGIKMATESEYEAQRISFEEAVKAYTIGAKYMHERLGEIKEGYISDLVAVKGDRIVLTLINGKIMYAQA